MDAALGRPRLDDTPSSATVFAGYEDFHDFDRASCTCSSPAHRCASSTTPPGSAALGRSRFPPRFPVNTQATGRTDPRIEGADRLNGRGAACRVSLCRGKLGLGEWSIAGVGARDPCCLLASLIAGLRVDESDVAIATMKDRKARTVGVCVSWAFRHTAASPANT